MKPLNLDNRPCSPISSNCVIWQGPTLDCINLCTGDTISDVVAKMAKELCTLLDQTNVNNYDLTCLGVTSCGPKDFQALIQLLIDKICELSNINPDGTKDEPACPDCVVSVASCLREQDSNLPATMQLLDYVQFLANKICSIIDIIADLQVQIDNLDIRVTILEEATPPSFTIPSIIVNCTLSEGVIIGGNSYTIDLVLNALINNSIYGYCELLGATGLPAELSSAVQSACITSTTPTLSNPPVPFGTEYLGSWVNSPTSAADAITNLWIVVCDLYNGFISSVSPTSVVTAGTGIIVNTSTVGTVTTYQVSEDPKPGLSVFLSPPANIFNTAPGLNSGRLCDGSIQVMSSIEYNDFGVAYDATTGIFTVPLDGVYQIDFFMHMTRDSSLGWFDAAVPGMITAGITSATGCNFYCVNNNSPVVTQKHSSINGSFTRKLTLGTQICLKVINLTNFDYLSETGDIAKFSVQRVN